MVVQGWTQYMGEKHSWGPCVVGEVEPVARDAAAVEVAAADMAAVETAAVVVPVDTAALALVVVGS
jgi:hypothetical protein